jgi:hypothetical protein
MATSQIKKFQRGSSGSISPWDLVASKVESSNRYKITVIPGLVNNFLAKNWNEEFLVNEGSLYYAKAAIETDGVAITDVTIKIDGTPPKIQSPQLYSIESSIEILFGLFRSGTIYRTVAVGQIFAAPRLWIRTEKPSPVEAGEIPYEEYFYFV